MTILEMIGEKPGPKPIQPLQAPEIETRLKAAKARLAELEAQHGPAALDAVAGSLDASEHLADLNQRLTKVREQVATLHSAHAAAVARDAATVQAQRTALRKTQINAIRKHLEARDAAAIALSSALEEAAKHFHTLLDRSEKALRACPLGMTWPDATLCELDALRALVANEMLRASASPANREGHKFTDPTLPSLDYAFQPKAVPLLADKIKAASQYTIAKLAEKEAQ